MELSVGDSLQITPLAFDTVERSRLSYLDDVASRGLSVFGDRDRVQLSDSAYVIRATLSPTLAIRRFAKIEAGTPSASFHLLPPRKSRPAHPLVTLTLSGSAVGRSERSK